MPVRTFIALELNPALKTELSAILSGWKAAYPSGINWVRDENLHLTMLFLGDTNEDVLPELKTKLGELCVQQAPFQIEAKGFELFPPKQIRMIWAQLQSPQKDIFKLNRRLLFETLNLGLEPDPKELRLHITMGRIKRSPGTGFEADILGRSLSVGLVLFDRLSLYKSVLRPEGPQYSLLDQYILR